MPKRKLEAYFTDDNNLFIYEEGGKVGDPAFCITKSEFLTLARRFLEVADDDYWEEHPSVEDPISIDGWMGTLTEDV